MTLFTRILDSPRGIVGNALYSSKILFVPLLLLTVLIGSGYSNELSNPQNYQANTKLSSLLAGEQFQLGVSCEQAVKEYNLDVARSHNKSDAIISSSLLGFNDSQRVDLGFFRGRCDAGQLRYVDKFVSVQDGILDRAQIFGDFVNQYGKPSAGGGDANFLRYYILFEGKYANFKFTLRQVDGRTIMIYELEDMTSDIKM